MRADNDNRRTEGGGTEVGADQFDFAFGQRCRGDNFVDAWLGVISSRADWMRVRGISILSESKDAEAKLLPKHTARLPRRRRRCPSRRAVFPTDARGRVW